MKIGIFYTTSNKSTEKSCKILSSKINAETRLVPLEKARGECILKYNFIILAGSAVNGKVQKNLKLYISRHIKNLKEKSVGLIINCEENIDRFNKTFTEELVSSSYIHSNFGYELDPNEGNFIEKRKTKKLIEEYKNDKKELPSLNLEEIDNFANHINNLSEKRID